jgi:hypothetical protein
MNDALLVRCFERLGNLPRNRQRLLDRDRPPRNAISERLPLDELQYQPRVVRLKPDTTTSDSSIP